MSFLGGGVREDAGIVDEDVGLAPVVLEGLASGADALIRGDVACLDRDFSSFDVAADLGRGPVQVHLLKVEERHRRARHRRGAGNGVADTTGGTGYDDLAPV